MKTLYSLAAMCGSAVLLVGCGAPAPATSGSVAPRPVKPYVLDFGGADAGIPISPSTDVKQYENLIAMQNVHPRTDPFALSPKENQFNQAQLAEYLLQQNGNMKDDFELPVPVDDRPPPEEPQPYRRVSGIIVADSVVAIIDMGDGKGAQIVRPGMYVPNTPWKVVAITEDEVVLQRDGNVRPKEVHVRLEQLPPEMRGGGGGETGGVGGTAPPPGRPGKGGGGAPAGGLGGIG